MREFVKKMKGIMGVEENEACHVILAKKPRIIGSKEIFRKMKIDHFGG